MNGNSNNLNVTPPNLLPQGIIHPQPNGAFLPNTVAGASSAFLMNAMNQMASWYQLTREPRLRMASAATLTSPSTVNPFMLQPKPNLLLQPSLDFLNLNMGSLLCYNNMNAALLLAGNAAQGIPNTSSSNNNRPVSPERPEKAKETARESSEGSSVKGPPSLLRAENPDESDSEVEIDVGTHPPTNSIYDQIKLQPMAVPWEHSSTSSFLLVNTLAPSTAALPASSQTEIPKLSLEEIILKTVRKNEEKPVPLAPVPADIVTQTPLCTEPVSEISAQAPVALASSTLALPMEKFPTHTSETDHVATAIEDNVKLDNLDKRSPLAPSEKSGICEGQKKVNEKSSVVESAPIIEPSHKAPIADHAMSPMKTAEDVRTDSIEKDDASPVKELQDQRPITPNAWTAEVGHNALSDQRRLSPMDVHETLDPVPMTSDVRVAEALRNATAEICDAQRTDSMGAAVSSAECLQNVPSEKHKMPLLENIGAQDRPKSSNALRSEIVQNVPAKLRNTLLIEVSKTKDLLPKIPVIPSAEVVQNVSMHNMPPTEVIKPQDLRPTTRDAPADLPGYIKPSETDVRSTKLLKKATRLEALVGKIAKLGNKRSQRRKKEKTFRSSSSVFLDRNVRSFSAKGEKQKSKARIIRVCTSSRLSETRMHRRRREAQLKGKNEFMDEDELCLQHMKEQVARNRKQTGREGLPALPLLSRKTCTEKVDHPTTLTASSSTVPHPDNAMLITCSDSTGTLLKKYITTETKKGFGQNLAKSSPKMDEEGPQIKKLKR
ncbi:unnamed protein product [Caenorhabditis sp. 36 PRJEB53466]|nr:unnamed protein product [Caenorhabditis sp. 36 PRJEB53466]